MKRDKLYTINKGNKPIFAQGVNRVNHNIFDGEFGSYMNNAYNPQIGSPLFRNNSTANPFGITLSAPTSSPNINWSSSSQRGNSGSSTGSGINWGAVKQGAQIGAGAILSSDLGDRALDEFDPIWHLAGQNHSAVGDSLSSAGKGIFKAGVSSGNPALMLAGAGAKIVGGLANAAFGYGIQNEQAVKNNIGNLKNVRFKGDFDAIQNQAANTFLSRMGLGKVTNGWFNSKGTRKAKDLTAQQENALAFANNSLNNAIYNAKQDQTSGLLRKYSAFGGPLGDSLGGALGIMQNDKYIDAINNRSNAIARNNMQTYSSTSLFGPRELYSCGGQIKPNKYEFGGLEASFVDNFAKDPLAAVLDYNRGIEQRAAAKEASEAAAAQEAMINELKLGLQKAQAENEGLWAMYGDQQKTLNGLLESSRYSAPYPTTSESGEGDLISGVANSGAKVVRDVMTGNNEGADDYRNLKEFIKKHESFVPKAYQLKGEAHPTIGYGFYDVYPGTNRKVKAGDTITKAEADKYLDAAIRNIDNILAPKVPNWSKMTNNQRDAIRDLAFGTGPYAAYFKPNSKLFQALRREDWVAAEKELRSKSGSLDIYNKGLAKRSDRRQAMWRAGDYSVKAFGGELGTNGSDFTNGLLEINAGGSHEDNPFEGVQLGVDQNGVPNLVEEGETVFNDYVFSKRMVVPDFMKKQLGLGSAKDDITFADASKKIAQESVERPNDPISQAGLEAGLAKLAEIQETERMRMQAEQENADMEMSMMQGLSAYGGNLFATGGPKGKGKTYNKTANEKSILERLANSIGLGEITSSSGVQKVLNELGFDKATIRRMQSDLVNLGILPEGGENGEQIGVVPFANRGRVGRVGNVGRAANVAKREMAASKLASRGQMPKNTPKTGRPRVVAETSTPRSTVQQQVRGGDVPAGWRVGRGNVEGSVADIGKGTRTALNVRPTVVGRGNVPSVLTPTPTAGASNIAGGILLGGLGLANIEMWEHVYNALSNKKQSANAGATNTPGSSNARDWSLKDIGDYMDYATSRLESDLGPFAGGKTASTEQQQSTPLEKVTAENKTTATRNSGAAPTNGRTTGNPSATPGTGGTPTNKPTATTTPATTPSVVAPSTEPYLYKDSSFTGWLPMDTPTEVPATAPKNPIEVIARDKGTTVTKNGTDFAPPLISTNSQGVIDSGEGTGIIDTESTDSADITEKQPKPYPTWMRYAPIVGTGIATMTDLLGLTNKDDFSDADKIEALAERAGYAPNIRAPYIGDYMRDIPFDRLFYANQLQANSRATDRGLMNTSGGNRGAAQAGMLANGYNSQLGLGNLYRQAEEYNRGQYERTKAFNRETNQFNAQMGLEADMANARHRQMASHYQLQGLGQAAAMRQAEKAKNSAAKSANFTKLLNNLGYLGAENFALNQILSSRDANNGYYTDNKGIVYHNGKAYAEVKNPSAFGGEVERYLKNKKKVRRSK